MGDKDLFVPVDIYLKSDRALKYGLLFIIMPFLALFLLEIFTKKRIHIIQYVLIGFANTLFYLLLLSIAEHLTFNSAYLLASVATTSLVVFYSASIFAAGNWGS